MIDKNMEPFHSNPYDLLHQLGVSANYKGFFLSAYAVTLCMQQQERPFWVTKWLYPEVAKHYGTNWRAVERNFERPLPLRGNRMVLCWKHLLKDISKDVHAPQNSLHPFFTLFGLKRLSWENNGSHETYAR